MAKALAFPKVLRLLRLCSLHNAQIPEGMTISASFQYSPNVSWHTVYYTRRCWQQAMVKLVKY